MKAGMMKRDRKLVAANLRNYRVGCNHTRIAQMIAFVAAKASIIAKDKSPFVPKEAQYQPFSVKYTIQRL